MTLRAEPSSKKPHPSQAIDALLESVAREHGPQSVGVILAGLTPDGSHGIQAIRNAGGIVFAQGPSAAQRVMPESAIATGCVDFVMTPSAIAAELVEIGAYAASLARAGESLAPRPRALQRIVTAVASASKIDLSRHARDALSRCVQRRARVHRATKLAGYARLVEREAAEARALGNELAFHTTGFFRDPEAFQALKTEVFPVLVQNRSRQRPIRIWVPGCSTGEEVYSIAISLLEFLQEAGAPAVPLRLFGTDASATAIAAARAAKYSAAIAREVAPGRLEAFFSRAAGTLRVAERVRAPCVFGKHELENDSAFHDIDLIGCRNLVLREGAPLRASALRTFQAALSAKGFLWMEPRPSAHDLPGLVPIDSRRSLFARAPNAREPATYRSRASSGERAAVANAPRFETDVSAAADSIVLDEFAPPGVVIAEDLTVVQFRGKTGRYLEPAPGPTTLDLLRMAREGLAAPLKQTIEFARSTRAPARATAILMSGDPRACEVEAIPFRVARTPGFFFLVLFKEAHAALPAVEGQPSRTADSVHRELASTREHLQEVIEQLEERNAALHKAHREIVSSHDELSAINEDLNQAQAEVRTANQELRTANETLALRAAESRRLGDDLTNVLTNIELPIVLLGLDMRIRMFTPAAERLLQLVESDVGRRLLDVGSPLAAKLARTAHEAFERLRAVVADVEGEAGHTYLVAARPYYTRGRRRIDGTVLTAFSIEAELKKSVQRLVESREYAQSVVDTVRECLLVLDGDLRVLSANRACLRSLGHEPADVEGRFLFEIDDGAWNREELTLRLKALGEGESFEGLRLVHKEPNGGSRVRLLHAHRIENTTRILLVMEDITENERATEALRQAQLEAAENTARYQEQLQHLAFEAALVEERERRRIALDLHDQVGQALTVAQMKLDGFREPLRGTQGKEMDGVVALIKQVVVDIRTLTFDLSPPILYDLGLKAALSWLVEDMEKRCGIRIELKDDGAPIALDETAAALVFRAVRELLMNVYKHAKSPTAVVSLRCADDHVHIDVEDAGVGFKVAQLNFRSPSGGFGLFSVREQIARLGGSLEIESVLSQGTRARLRVPLSGPSERGPAHAEATEAAEP